MGANGCQWVATVVVVRGSVAPNAGSVGFGVCVLPTMLPIAPECSPVEETVAGRGQPPKKPLCTNIVLCAVHTVHLYCAVCSHIVLFAPILCCVHPHCAVCTLTGLCAPTFILMCGSISHLLRRIKQILSNQTY